MRFTSLTLVACFLMVMFVGLVPTANAEVITSLSGASSAITTIQTNSYGLQVNQVNGKLLMTYTDEVGGSDDNCRIALSLDFGATWFRDKTVGISANSDCISRWVPGDADSFYVMGGSNPGGPTIKRSDNDGLTFTTITACGASCISGNVLDFEIGAADGSILGIFTSTGSASRFAYTYNGGTSWAQGTTNFGGSGFLHDIRYGGSSGAWSAGMTQSANNYFAATTDNFNTLSVQTTAWDTSGEGDWTSYTASCDGHDNYLGLFTGANSAFSTSRDVGLEYGTGGPQPVYQNAGASRTISPSVIECVHDNTYFAFKQTGDTITPRFVIGSFIDGTTVVRQIEDLDASATAALTSNREGAFGEHNGTIYIVYRDGSGAAARARLITAADFSAASDAIPNVQVAVNNLVGYSMDNTGRTIIARTDSGATIESYSTSPLLQTGTATTPDCSRIDGVLAASLLEQKEIYLTYADCDGSGDVDALRIRNFALGAPTFYDGEFGTPCEFQESDNLNDGDTNIPNDLFQIGLITSMAMDFHRCSNTGINYGAASWAYTEPITGRIGIFAVLYKTGTDQQDTSTVLVDTSPSPNIAEFCSWSNAADGNDYMAAISNGPTGVYQSNTEIQTNNGIVADVDVSLTPKFVNNGQYGAALGIACTKTLVALYQSDMIHLLDGTLNGTSSDLPGWPIPITGATQYRGAAITGSGRFIAYLDGNVIKVVATNGTQTGEFPAPTGTWRGMEFDNSGEKLAVFTSDFITLYETTNITCATTGTCAAEGGIGDDNLGGNNTTPPTDEPPGGGFGSGGGILGLAADVSVYFAILTILAFAIIGWGITGAKKGRGDE